MDIIVSRPWLSCTRTYKKQSVESSYHVDGNMLLLHGYICWQYYIQDNILVESSDRHDISGAQMENRLIEKTRNKPSNHHKQMTQVIVNPPQKTE